MAMGTTNAVGGEVLKAVSTSMEVVFDNNLGTPTAPRVKYTIIAKDGGSIPAGTLTVGYGYEIDLGDYGTSISTASMDIAISAGNTASGFLFPPSGQEKIVSIASFTFKNGSTTYVSQTDPIILDNITRYVVKNQGTANAGKVLGIGSNGMVTPVDAGGSGGSGGSGNFVTYIFSSTQSAYNTPTKFFTKIIEIVVPGDLICFRICKSGTGNIFSCSFNGMVGTKASGSVYLIGSGGFIKDGGVYLFGGDSGTTNHGANMILRSSSVDVKGYKDFSGSQYQMGISYTDNARWGKYDVIIWHNTGGYGSGSLDGMPDT